MASLEEPINLESPGSIRSLIYQCEQKEEAVVVLHHTWATTRLTAQCPAAPPASQAELCNCSTLAVAPPHCSTRCFREVFVMGSARMISLVLQSGQNTPTWHKILGVQMTETSHIAQNNSIKPHPFSKLPAAIPGSFFLLLLCVQLLSTPRPFNGWRGRTQLCLTFPDGPRFSLAGSVAFVGGDAAPAPSCCASAQAVPLPLSRPGNSEGDLQG